MGSLASISQDDESKKSKKSKSTNNNYRRTNNNNTYSSNNTYSNTNSYKRTNNNTYSSNNTYSNNNGYRRTNNTNNSYSNYRSNDRRVAIPEKKDNRPLTVGERQQVSNIVGAALALEFGFRFASYEEKRNISRCLSMTRPSGGTAMRDAVVLGLYQLMKLQEYWKKMGSLEHYKVIHIVVTDGEDTSSKISEKEYLGLFHITNEAFGSSLSTYFVCVEMLEKHLVPMLATKLLAEQSTHLINAKNMEINSVFERIGVEMGIINETLLVTNGRSMVGVSQNKLAMRFQRHNFLVLFTLDISGSMNDRSRWTYTQKAVNGLLNKLEKRDLVGVTTFNSKPQMLTAKR